MSDHRARKTPSRKPTAELSSTNAKKRDERQTVQPSKTDPKKLLERSPPKSEKPHEHGISTSETEEEVVDDDYRRNPYKTKFHRMFGVQDKEYIWRYEPEYSDIGRDLCTFSSVGKVPVGDGKKGEKLQFYLHSLVGKGSQHRGCFVEGKMDELLVLLPSGPKVEDKPLYLEPMNKRFIVNAYFNPKEYDLAAFAKHHSSGPENAARNLKRTRKDIEEEYYAIKDGKKAMLLSIEECVKAFGFGNIDLRYWKFEPEKTSLVKEIAVFTRVQSKDQHRERGKVYEEYICVGKGTMSRSSESTLFSDGRGEIVVLFSLKDSSKDALVLVPEEKPEPHKILCQFIPKHYDVAVIVRGDNIYEGAKKSGKVGREDIHESRYVYKDGMRIGKGGAKSGVMVTVPNPFTGTEVNGYMYS